MIALDLDGTLVAENDVLSPDAADAVRAAQAAGAHVVLATGRGWHATRWVAEALGLPPGPHVCSNGAVVVEYPPFKVLEQVTFDAQDAIERVTAEHPQSLLATEVVGKGYLVNRAFPEGELGGQVTVVPTEELFARPTTRVIVRDPDGTEEGFVELAHRLGLEGVSYSIGYTAWLDLAPEGVDKATGLESVAARLGLTAADVLAIGDGRNDIEMLQWAGRGVTFPDSPPEVIAAADAVTTPFAAGGTAAELRRWF